MIRNNKFFVKKYDEDENKITLEEERRRLNDKCNCYWSRACRM